jgi:hypothetical protein
VRIEGRHAAIISPTVDLLLVGGLSIIVLVPLLLSGRSDLVIIGAGAQAWIAATINMPHFIASYRLVYRSRDMIRRHMWASVYIPALLLLYTIVALWEAQESPVFVIILVAVASAYLAWHYTGQVWGMMASFAFLEGLRFETRERLLIRTSLRVLLAWHVTWFLYTQLRDPSKIRPLYVFITSGTLVAFAMGLVGLRMMWRRTGKLPPTRALVAWLAIFVWYAAMARDPKAIFWIQIFHALQYLAFPIRVEINRTSAADDSGTRGSAAHDHHSSRRMALHMLLYGGGLLAVSYVVAGVVPGTAMGIVGNIFGEEPSKVAPILILMFINIHHYFTDGVIWKISNPEVRRDLFAHVQPSDKETAVSAPVTGGDPTKRKHAKIKR